MSEREQFETAYRQEFGKRWVCPQRQDMFKRETNRYAHLSVQDMWVMWQAARAQPAQAGQVLTDAELAALMPPPDIDGSKARSPNAVRLAMRAIEQAVMAKRVPMTDEQVVAAFVREPIAVSRHDFTQGIRYAEVWHGIVGENGGA